MTNRLHIAVAACSLVAAFAPHPALAVDTHHPPHVYLRVHVDINRDGYMFDVEPVDVTVPVATKLACVAYTNDEAGCTALAGAMGSRAHTNPHDKHDGDRHTGIFVAPTGYEICTARIRPGTPAVEGGSSLVASYMRNTDGLGEPNDPTLNGLSYDIHEGTGAGREHGIHAVIDLDFIEAKAVADPASGCAPTGGQV